MSFQTPLALAALTLIPLALLLYVFAQKRKRRYAVRFPAVATVARVVKQARWKRHVPASLMLLALAAGVLAAARPEATVAVPVEKASVMLVTDGSGSMAANDVDPSRLEAAQSAATDFLDEVPEELQAGFVGFSTAAHTVVPPTTDRGPVEDALDGLQADGGTATGDALRAALDSLPDRSRGGDRPPAAILLLSDGRRTQGSDPVEAAREAARQGVPVFTVSLGTDGGTLETPAGSQAVPPDPQTMRTIAEITNGQAYTTDDAGELGAIYERLGSQIGTRDEEREVTAAFAGGALLLLGGAFVTSLRGFGRLP